MICTLSKEQQEATLKLLNGLVRVRQLDTPETILRNVYDVVFESFVEKNMQKDAEPYALSMTQYAAENLHLLLEVEDDSIRRLFAKFAGTKDQFTTESIERFKKEDELRKFLGLRENNLNVVHSSIKREDVQTQIDVIAKSFPKIDTRATFVRTQAPYYSWLLPITKDKEGKEVSLISVTDFLNTSRIKSTISSDHTTLRAGILTDLVIRKYFKNPVDYDTFKKNMASDKEFVSGFRRFAENSHVTPETEMSPIVQRYMEEYLSDMMYVINFIQTSYQDSYITDLSDLVEKSTMNEEERRKFFVYSAELGIRGELDLIAIKPDGTFTVIDLKTTDGLGNKTTFNKHARQASVYDLIISSVTGLKSSGTNDIIYITRSITNPSNILGKKGGFYKMAISNFDKRTNKNHDSKMLELEISLYKKQIDSSYRKSENVADSNQEVKAFNPLTVRDMMRAGQQRPKGPNLKQIFNENEPLSTYEDLTEGKKWLHSVFPELKDGDIRIIRMINSPSGGEFFLDSINLYEQSNKGVAYHEGWHRFTQVFMTKKEKTNLYNSVKDDNIDFTTRDGRQLSTSTASFLDIEEFMAEEFKNYALDPKQYQFPKGNTKVKSWFRKIWDALKSIFTFWQKRGSFAYEELFRNLYTGTFNRNHYSTNNAMFKHLNSFFISSKKGKSDLIDNITFLKFRDFSDFTLSEFLLSRTITITDLLDKEGVGEITNAIRDGLTIMNTSIDMTRTQIAEQIAESKNDDIIERLKANDKNLAFYNDTLNFILEQDADGNYVNFADYIRAYFKTSKYDTLRTFFSKNTDIVNRIIDEESLADFEKEEEEGEQLEDFDDKPDTTQDAEYNNPGNLKAALEFARAELKDFFVGIPRRTSADIELENDPSLFEYDKNGMVVTISKQEAFYKTLNVLQGSLTWEEITQRLNNSAYYSIFPELLSIKEKLLGSSSVKGLVPRLQELSELILTNTATVDDIDEHSKLMSFLMHFAHVLSLRKVPFDTAIIRLNFDTSVETFHSVRPVQTRENLESIVYSIMHDFTKGFQIDMEKKFIKSDKEYKSMYEVLHEIFGRGEQGFVDFMMNFDKYQFLYDPQYKKFYFNSLYIYKRFENRNPDNSQLKDFFSHLGITINDKAYENKNHRTELLDIYNQLRDILFTFHRNSVESAQNLYNSTGIAAKVEKWKQAKDALVDPQLTGLQKFLASTNLVDVELELTKYVNRIFTNNPVNQMLFDGKDKRLMMKDSRNKIFAANLHIFQRLAKIEKNYHKRFSSGSMIVMNKLQFSHYLPNNMLITEMYVNDHIRHFSDFAKHPALSHIDPISKPQILNSWMFSRLFAQDGTKRDNFKLSISNLSQISVIFPDQTLESKGIQELKEDEKMLFDLILGITDGSNEIRRMETSNTAWRQALVYMDGNERQFIKPVTIGVEGFSNPTFLSIVRNYIQHAAWKYQYYRNPDNRAMDKDHGKPDERGVDRRDTLGIFDEVLVKSGSKIKKFIEEQGGDMNTLMSRIEKSDPELFTQINTDLATFFEDITINNKDSYKNVFSAKISDKGKNILAQLSNIIQNRTITDYTGNVTDTIYRDFIANDFIGVMEDSILFFGDYTYYKDPIKRRKIIGNNGSVHIVDSLMEKAIEAQKQANSLSGLYQKEKNLVKPKDYKLVKKSIVSDVKMTSNQLRTDENGDVVMLKKLQLLRKQRYGMEVSLDDLAEEKKETIAAFTDMEVADAAAWISLDTLRLMRLRERTWNDNDENEYKRQLYIMKENLDIPLTEEEQAHVDSGPYSGFNVSKFALTGAMYDEREGAQFRPTFDKMGLRVLLPEVDWNRNTRPIFEKMLEEDLDYIVFDTGSKGYKSPVTKVFSDNGLTNTLDKDKVAVAQHAGAFFKYQQNTTQLNDKSTFSVQLRSIFYEIMLIQKKHGYTSPSLQKAYSKMISSLSDYITINSSRSLTEMGLDIRGNIRDRATFINYLRNRLLEIGNVDEKLLDLLQVNANGSLKTFLEALPFQKNIIDLIAGVIDDNFRKIKLNGTKFYQSPEIGTTIDVKRVEALPVDQRGTIELQWHDLEIVDDQVVSTTPVECKINFRKQFYPLLNLKHPDGERIATLKRLNEAISNKEWAKTNYDSITYVGVRIPLQDINFTSHIIVKEFLPESVGDMIILPPEFYKQTGSDNDIDTVTATFKYLDAAGKPIKRPKESFEDIVNRINELSVKVSGIRREVSDTELKDELTGIMQDFIDSNVYASRERTLEDMNADFTIVEMDGFRTVAGLVNSKSLLHKLQLKGEENQLMDILSNFVAKMNDKRKITSPELIELNNLTRKKNNYIKGVTNDMVSSVITFMEAPETFDFLTETDSITRIKEIATGNLARVTGVDESSITLAAQQSPIKALSYVMNLVNHRNNFEVRSILGSVIKFRSILSLLDAMDTKLNNEYIGGSMMNLLTRTTTSLELAQSALDKSGKTKTYRRKIYTPLLYNKDISKGISISIYDENGQRTTKNLSMLASSLLDLFKNMDVFPSLGITWLNVKPLIFLMATGVPMERAIIFLNNPVIQEIQKKLNTIGSDARDRHAIVAAIQEFSGEEIFKTGKYEYDIYNPDITDRLTINHMLKRPSKAGESYLDGKHITFTEEDLKQFTIDYAKFLNDPTRAPHSKNLTRFFRDYPQYEDFAKQIGAYYATLWEDGDVFYAYFVKGLNRNSAKMNSNAATSTAQSVKKARVNTGIANPDFEDKLETISSQSPFYKDAIIQNILANTMPNLLKNDDRFFSDKFHEALIRTVSKTVGTPEDKKNVELRFMSDFVEMVYKNFFILKDPQLIDVEQNKPITSNTLYEYMELDITPLLRPMVEGVQNYKKFLEEFSQRTESQLTEEARIESLYDQSLLAHQVEVFQAKYPELMKIRIVNELMAQKEHSVDPQKDGNFEAKDILNQLTQSYIIVNMSTNPNDKEAEESEMRDEWEKLLHFDLSQFPGIEADIASNPERIDFYRNPNNITEIRKLFRLLAYYSLAQSSHLTKTRASFSYMAPTEITTKVVQEAFENFNNYLKSAGSVFTTLPSASDKTREDVITNLMDKFEKMFKDMNGDLKWQNPEGAVIKKTVVDTLQEGDEMWGTEDAILGLTGRKQPERKGLPYKKSHTGKLYSKLEDDSLDLFKKKLAKEQNIVFGARNTFRINMSQSSEDIDPLECKI